MRHTDFLFKRSSARTTKGTPVAEPIQRLILTDGEPLRSAGEIQPIEFKTAGDLGTESLAYDKPERLRTRRSGRTIQQIYRQAQLLLVVLLSLMVPRAVPGGD